MVKAQDMQVHEICQQIEKTPKYPSRVEYLRGFANHQPLMYLLMWNFGNVTSLLPEGTPPFNDADQDGPAKSSMWSYLKVLPSFVHCEQGLRIKPLQRETMFIEMLNALDPAEARLVCAIKDKSLSKIYPSITVDLVHAAFPHLGLLTTAPRELTEEEIKEQVKEQLAAAEKQMSDLKAHITSLKAKLKG